MNNLFKVASQHVKKLMKVSKNKVEIVEYAADYRKDAAQFDYGKK